MRGVLKSLLRLLLGPYRFNRIYEHKLTPGTPSPTNWDIRRIQDKELRELEASPDLRVRNSVAFAGERAYGFGLWKEAELASVCWIWAAGRTAPDMVWEPRLDEAVLVEVVTREDYRGLGFAPALIDHAAQLMAAEGINRIYAWIWWNHWASITAFEKVNWHYIAFVAEVFPFGKGRKWRLVRWLDKVPRC